MVMGIASLNPSYGGLRLPEDSLDAPNKKARHMAGLFHSADAQRLNDGGRCGWMLVSSALKHLVLPATM